MSIIAQIMKATLNKDSDTLSDIYKNLVKFKRIKPLYFDLEEYDKLINFDFKEKLKIIASIKYLESNDLLYYYLLLASPLILETIKNLQNG